MESLRLHVKMLENKMGAWQDSKLVGASFAGVLQEHVLPDTEALRNENSWLKMELDIANDKIA